MLWDYWYFSITFWNIWDDSWYAIQLSYISFHWTHGGWGWRKDLSFKESDNMSSHSFLIKCLGDMCLRKSQMWHKMQESKRFQNREGRLLEKILTEVRGYLWSLLPEGHVTEGGMCLRASPLHTWPCVLGGPLGSLPRTQPEWKSGCDPSWPWNRRECSLYQEQAHYNHRILKKGWWWRGASNEVSLEVLRQIRSVL